MSTTASTITSGDHIYSVAFTADGKDIVGGGDGGGIYRWKVEDSRQVGSIMSAEGTVLAVVVSRNGRWIITGDAGNKMIVWNARTHEKVMEMRDHMNWVRTVDASGDSRRVASGSYDRTVRISSIVTGQNLIPPLQHDNWVVSVKFSPTGDRIATATFDRASVRVYDSHTGNKLFDIPVQVKSYPITPLSWSRDGQLLFAASPRKITCLDTSTSSHFAWSIPNAESQVSIVTNGSFIACSAGSSVSFWDPISHEQIGTTLQCSTTISCIILSHDGKYLACGHGNTISVHRLNETLPNSSLPPPSSRPPLMEVSVPALEAWLTQDDQENTETILSEEIGQLITSNYHTLANRALIRAQLKKWNTAIEDANLSLQIKPSPIGHIAKSIALTGAGNTNIALSEFDFAFCVCNPIEVKFLFVIKSIIVFISRDHEDAIFRLTGLIADADDDTRSYCIQVLGNMYLQKGDYESAIRSLQGAARLTTNESPHLTTISLIFGWSFHETATTAWTRLCEALCRSGRIKEVGETLVRMVDSLVEHEREAAHCCVLEEIVARSGDPALLSWTGRSSAYNSCLPASPNVYTQPTFTPLPLEGADTESSTAELRTMLSLIDALIIHDRITRLQPVRFTNHRLLLPCLPFRVRALTKNETNTYRAKVAWLGDVEFTTNDKLPLKEPQRLVFVHPWMRHLRGPHSDDGVASEDESDAGADSISTISSGSASVLDFDAEIVHASLVEEAPSASDPSETYARALQVIARLGQPFNALLLVRQTDGTYKRVAAEHEIIVPGLGCNVPKDIRAEILEVV